jgi:hypothetical protein
VQTIEQHNRLSYDGAQVARFRIGYPPASRATLLDAARGAARGSS